MVVTRLTRNFSVSCPFRLPKTLAAQGLSKSKIKYFGVLSCFSLQKFFFIKMSEKKSRWKYTWRAIEVVITSSTRNRVAGKTARGFESHALRHDKLTDYTKGAVCQLFIYGRRKSRCTAVVLLRYFYLLGGNCNERDTKK